VEGLVNQVRAFEDYLAEEWLRGGETAGEQEIRAYAGSGSPSTRKKRMRAVALYYRFIENEALAKLAGAIREQEIAKTRKAFKLRDFLGVDAKAAARLEAAGIADRYFPEHRA
jgi:hypothetical protein